MSRRSCNERVHIWCLRGCDKQFQTGRALYGKGLVIDSAYTHEHPFAHTHALGKLVLVNKHECPHAKGLGSGELQRGRASDACL